MRLSSESSDSLLDSFCFVSNFLGVLLIGSSQSNTCNITYSCVMYHIIVFDITSWMYTMSLIIRSCPSNHIIFCCEVVVIIQGYCIALLVYVLSFLCNVLFLHISFVIDLFSPPYPYLHTLVKLISAAVILTVY